MFERDRQLGVREAADACGVSDETIRRRLRAGELPHARRDGSPFGPWRIPVSDLLASGLEPREPQSADPRLAAELGEARAEITTLRIELARAETLAGARLDELRAVRAHLDDLRTLAGTNPACDTEGER